MLLAHRTLHAFRWSLIGEAAGRAIPPLTFALLALLLVPEDFGVLAAATVIISLCTVFAEAGLGKAVVQTSSDAFRSASTALWISLVLGSLATLLLALLSPLVAMFFRDPRIGDVVRALSLQCLLSGLTAIPSALLQRELRFKALAASRLAGAIVSMLVALPLALRGAGYWALVAAALTGQLTQLSTAWIASGWRPGPGLSPPDRRALLTFGGWATASGLLGWGFVWGDALVVARYLGAHDMGLYRVGNSLVIAAFGLAFAPLLPVLFSVFSRHRGDLQAIRADLESAARMIALVSLPGGAMLALASPAIDALMSPFGWNGIGSAIGVLGVCHGLAWIVGANGEALRGAGRPHGETLAMAVAIPMYFIAYFVAVRHGLEAFLWTRAGCSVLGVLIQVTVAKYIIGFPVSRWMAVTSGPALLALLVLLVYPWVIDSQGQSVMRASLALGVATILWIGYVMTFERQRLGRILAAVSGRPTGHEAPPA